MKSLLEYIVLLRLGIQIKNEVKFAYHAKYLRVKHLKPILRFLL